VREVCEELDRRKAYGFAFAPSSSVVRLYARFGFRAVGRTEGDCGLVGMLREPVTRDNNVSVSDEAKAVEPRVSGLKRPEPKTAKLKTPESKPPWLNSPNLKESEREVPKRESPTSMASESQISQTHVLEPHTCVLQASTSQTSESAAVDSTGPYTKASKKEGLKSKAFKSTAVEPKPSQTFTAELSTSGLSTSGLSTAGSPASGLPSVGSSASEPQKSKSPSHELEAPELKHLKLVDSKESLPKAAESNAAQSNTSESKTSTSKERKTDPSDGKPPAATLNDIQSTIKRIETTALAHAIMHEAEGFAASGETIRVFGNFAHLGVDPGTVDVGPNRSRFRFFEIVKGKPDNNAARETSIGKADAAKLLREAKCECLRWPRAAKAGTAEKGKRKSREGRKESR